MRVPFIPNTIIMLLVVLGGVYLLGLRAGKLESTFTPLPVIDLRSGSGWFVDWRLAALESSPDVCKAILSGPQVIVTSAGSRQEGREGCGYRDAFGIEEVGGAQLGASPLSCQATAALALWVNYVVQPEAERLFNSRVASIGHMGTYSCREKIGSNIQWYKKAVRSIDPTLALSQHATANAIDIGGFRLESGETITVLDDWRDKGPKGDFLHRVHSGACNYFRVTLGPEFNKEHANHFHLDRGFGRICW